MDQRSRLCTRTRVTGEKHKPKRVYTYDVVQWLSVEDTVKLTAQFLLLRGAGELVSSSKYGLKLVPSQAQLNGLRPLVTHYLPSPQPLQVRCNL